MKVDLAIQSYRKPERMALTLLSLHKHSAKHIDNVFINDDGSTHSEARILHHPALRERLSPWNIKIRSNLRRMGWWYAPVKGISPKYPFDWRQHLKFVHYVLRTKSWSAHRSDIRYQWALDTTKKGYLYIIHDDVDFYDDVLGTYMSVAENEPEIGGVGDLGQCWRCAYRDVGCTPRKILDNYRPSREWPDFTGNYSNRWPCRLNEWSVLISVDAAKKIEANEGVLFGNYENNGDVGAYWFATLVKAGFKFHDPYPDIESRRGRYLHADGGSGHSTWVNQGGGKSLYAPEKLRERLNSEFQFAWPD